MKLLVLTSEPITARQLREALPGDLDPEHFEVMVVAPAIHDSWIRFWLSDADEAIAKADALQSFKADRIIVFTHGGAEQRYREDIDAREIEQRFGVPVDHATVSG
jgi:hypothetical protein